MLLPLMVSCHSLSIAASLGALFFRPSLSVCESVCMCLRWMSSWQLVSLFLSFCRVALLAGCFFAVPLGRGRGRGRGKGQHARRRRTNAETAKVKSDEKERQRAGKQMCEYCNARREGNASTDRQRERRWVSMKESRVACVYDDRKPPCKLACC